MATWTPGTKNSSVFSNASKSTSTDKLLLESGSYTLLETGDRLLLESVSAPTWAGQTKN